VWIGKPRNRYRLVSGCVCVALVVEPPPKSFTANSSGRAHIAVRVWFQGRS